MMRRSNKLRRYIWISLSVLLQCFSGYLLAQNAVSQDAGKAVRRLETAVPFLLVAPDARAGAMGETGAATSPDASSAHWNPSKLAFVSDTLAVSLSYSPWLRTLVSDMYLAYVNGYYKLDERNTVGASFRYFTAGDIELRESPDLAYGTFRPNEFAIDATYARKFGNNFSLGTSVRFIYSNISNAMVTQGQQAGPASALAADVSAYYTHATTFSGRDLLLAFGGAISNIGSKISYSNEGSGLFLPTNLKIGTAATVAKGKGALTFALDVNKLLVPSPPLRDSQGKIVSGSDPNKSVPAAMFGSFSDAPGGFSEELKEISIATGLEYVYNKQLAARMGYFYESRDKGDRRYLTFGGGYRYQKFNLDFSYLAASQTRSPLANTLRFTIAYTIR
ncbi:type IX secretion system outer membrane channel protein PorV [Arcticibacter sp. MXS-1]|uniref:type IX secretion system outer membrane channel protein PorV n=1 Tax=Arcticibacter sp. MXS-1 TaxID=3341726 RepID=UPI0035A96185